MGTTADMVGAVDEGVDLPPCERDDGEPSFIRVALAYAALCVGGFAFGALGAYAVLRALGKV